jgi:putative colanic acid biosynthesis glycosyltransferase
MCLKISIITINLNNAKGLEKTFDSIRIQTNKNYELIIIDGKSTDNSLEIIEKNKDMIRYFVSEPDEGIYYAMNKGLDIAHGDFAVFLNSGDSFYDDTVLDFLINNISDSNKVYFGSAKIFSDKNAYYIYPQADSDAASIEKFLKYYKPCHQAVFFPREFFAKNKYNTQYSIFSDVDYKIRAINSCGYIFINKIIVYFIQGGFSSADSLLKIRLMNHEYVSIYKLYSIYSLNNYIRFIIGLIFKYIFYFIFKNKANILLTKTRAFFH